MSTASPRYKRILLFGIPGASFSSVGTSDWGIVRQLNYDLRAAWPQYYVVDAQGRDLRERLIASYDPGQAQDVADRAADVTPTSLRLPADPQHLNNAGRIIWATIAAEFRAANY